MEQQKIKFLRPAVLIILSAIILMVYIRPAFIFAEVPAGITLERGGHGGDIYANGNAIIVTAGAVDGRSLIYLDTNSNGIIDGDEEPVALETCVGFPVYDSSNTAGNITGNTTDGYTLSKYSVFGGANGEGNNVESTKITMLSGTINGIRGGGRHSVVSGDTNITVAGGSVGNILGSGAPGAVGGDANITISGGSVGTVSGAHADNGSSVGGTVNISMTGGTVGSIYGGGAEAVSVGNTSIIISGGTVSGDIFGGGKNLNANVTGNTRVEITGTALVSGSVYGGGQSFNAAVTGNTSVVISGGTVSGSVYGGGYAANTTVGSTSVVISGGSAQYVYGGGHSGIVTGNTRVQITGTAIVSGSVYGGGHIGAITGNTSVIVSGGSADYVYAGGHSGFVTGNTSVTLSGGSVSHVFGGGLNGAVTGNTSVTVLDDALITGSLFGGGNAGSATSSSTSVTLSGGSIGEVVCAGGHTGNVTGDTIITLTGTTSVNNSISGLGLGCEVSGTKYLRFGVDAVGIDAYIDQSDNYDLLQYEVAFYDTDGTTRLTAPASQWVTENTAATQPSSPSKSGYNFEKWLDDADEFDFATLITIPKKLKSTWSLKPTYTTFTPPTPTVPGGSGWNNVISDINEAQDGSTVEIKLNGANEVPKSVFEEIKGKDITILLDMGNGFVWKINGKDVTNPKNVNLSVKIPTAQRIPVDVINLVTGEKLELYLSFDGDFGLKATLMIDLKKSNSGYFANLFYYNPTTKALEYVSSGKIGSDGKAGLDFFHASDYVIVISSEIMTSLTAEPDSEPTDNPKTGESAFPVAIALTAVMTGIVLYKSEKKKK